MTRLLSIFVRFLCFLVILVFLLPPESGEKMGLAITTFLTLMVANQLAADQTPPSYESPLIMKFFMHAMILNALSLIMSIIVLRMHHYEPCIQRPMNRLGRWLFLKVMPSIIRHAPPGCNKPPGLLDSETWRFPKKGEKQPKRRLSIGSTSIIYKDESSLPAIAKLSIIEGKAESEMNERDVLLSIKRVLSDTLDTVRKINRKSDESDFRSEEKVVGAEEEWMFAAFIVDRFLLITFIAYLLIIVVVYAVPLIRDSLLDN